MSSSLQGELTELIADADLAAFDFDGVIADTEPLHAASYQQLLADVGVAFNPADFAPYVGKPDREIYRLLNKQYGVSLDMETIGGRRKELFVKASISSGLQPYPYVVPVLNLLDDCGCRAIILSSQSRQVVECLLQHWALITRFERVITVREGVPGMATKAELVATLSAEFHLSSRAIILFEDSVEVLAESRRSGVRTVGVMHALASIRHQGRW